jgi:RNA polymerase sigma-70 factor (ECF subfamily)
MNEARSARLISACLTGDDEAITLLVRQYEAGVFRLALSIVGDPAEANDITQETFLAALRALPSYKEQQSFRAWLYKIALNQSRSHLRKRKVLERLRNSVTYLFQSETQRQPLPEDMSVQHEKEAAVWQGLNQLDERRRTVLILRYFQELSIAEIAEVLSTNEGTVHSRLHSARERLRQLLKDLQDL